MNKYRLAYSRYTNSDIPHGCDIHHLDGDRWNNEPENLICIEAFVHKNYHKCLRYCWEIIYTRKSNLPSWFHEEEINRCTAIINDAIHLREFLHSQG